MADKITTILLTGSPGVGKTTLVRKVCETLQQDHISYHGFYTEEVRDPKGATRVGFDVVELQPHKEQRAILARENPSDGISRPKVGKYAVFVNDFEAITLPLISKVLKSGSIGQLLVIDEIGKMELLSRKFETGVKQILDQRIPLLATIPSRTRQPLAIVERLKASPHTKVFQVTRANRNLIQQDIVNCAKQFLLG